MRPHLPKEECPTCHCLYVPPLKFTCALCGKGFTKAAHEVEKYERKIGKKQLFHFCCRDHAFAGWRQMRASIAIPPTTNSQQDWDKYLQHVGLGVHAGERPAYEVAPIIDALDSESVWSTA